MSHPYLNRHSNPSPLSVYMHSPMGTLMPESVLYSSKKLQHINCIEQPTQDYGGLYLGDIITIIKPEIVPNYQIGAILSCLSETNYSSNLSSNIIRKTIAAKDAMDYPLNIHFDQCYTFIETMRRQKKNVLVHCHAGVSRSAAIVCAYLMRKCSWSCDQAVTFLRQRRNRVKPNQNFLRLLKQYEQGFQMTRNSQSRQNLQRNELSVPKRDPRSSASYYQERNSLEVKPDRKFISIVDESRSIETGGDTSRLSRNNNQSESQLKQRFSFRMSLKDSENRATNRSFHKATGGQKKNQQTKKQELSFGNQFKNKISALLGRKTRIAWELSEKNQNIDFEDTKFQINCI